MALSGARERRLEGDDNSDATSKPVHIAMMAKKHNDEVPSLLVKLSGEVRNKIWAHTFDYYDYVNCGRRIDITCFRHFPKMPSAAAVCHQMLAEVLGVFLNETEFVIWISNCEGKRDVPANEAYMKLCKLQREIGQVESAPSKLSDAKNAPLLQLSGEPWFERIVRWAKAIHSSDVDLEYDFREVEGWFKILFEMLQTAVTLRGAPWDDVKKVLYSMRRIAATERDAIDAYVWVRGYTGGGSDFSVTDVGSDDEDLADGGFDVDGMHIDGLDFEAESSSESED